MFFCGGVTYFSRSSVAIRLISVTGSIYNKRNKINSCQANVVEYLAFNLRYLVVCGDQGVQRRSVLKEETCHKLFCFFSQKMNPVST